MTSDPTPGNRIIEMIAGRFAYLPPKISLKSALQRETAARSGWFSGVASHWFAERFSWEEVRISDKIRSYVSTAVESNLSAIRKL